MSKSFLRDQKLRVVEFNVENLFVYLDLYEGQNLSELTEKQWQKLTISTVPLKPLAQVQQLAQAIRDMDPDILMLCEVGGGESLRNFSRYFLNDEYQPYLIEGNSDRGIDLGYLVRKSLPIEIELRSHRDRTIDFMYPHEKLSKETGYAGLRSAKLTSHKFSRDVLELRAFDRDRRAEDPPCLILLLVHLKSQLDRSRIDPHGRDRRKAELEKLVKIYKEIKDEVGSETPILLGGDFNGVAALPSPDPEFDALYRQTDLKDCLEVAGVPSDERFTHMQIHTSRYSMNKQLDYIFVPRQLSSRVNKSETWVFRFKDERGTTRLIPRSLVEKRALPSDHYPVILTLDAEDPTSRNSAKSHTGL